MNNLSKIAKKLISQAKKDNIYLVLRFQDYKARSMSAKGGKIDDSDFAKIKGTGIHAFTRSGHTGFSSVDTTKDEKRILRCLEAAINAANTAKSKGFEPTKEIFNLKPTKDQVFQKVPINPFKIQNEKLQNDLLAFHKKLVKENKGLSVANMVLFTSDHRRIFRSDSTDVRYRVYESGLASLISMNLKGNINSLYQVNCSRGYEVLTNKANIKLHRKALNNKLQYIEELSKVESITPGNYPLLLDGIIAGVFIHEAFGHTAESEKFYQKSPLLKNGKIRRGIKVAKSFVNIFDDADKNERGFNPFSSYGVRRKKAIIVKNGKINNLISDVITAKRTNSDLTGAARADSYSSIPCPRMTCTKISLDKRHTIPLNYNHLTAKVERVHKSLKTNKIFRKYPVIIYLMGSGGGNVDAREGNFQFGTKVCFKIRKNSITLLKPVSFSGVTLEALKSVELAFGKPVYVPGLCGKWGQEVTGSEKAPMLLLASNKYVTIG